MNGEKGSLVTESLFYFSRSGKAQAATRQFYQAQKSKKPALKAGFLNLAPLTGLEPVTYGLTVRRSTD